MSIKEKAGRISDRCDGALHHPNIIELEDDPDASLDDYRFAVKILTEALQDIWALAGEIHSES